MVAEEEISEITMAMTMTRFEMTKGEQTANKHVSYNSNGKINPNHPNDPQ